MPSPCLATAVAAAALLLAAPGCSHRPVGLRDAGAADAGGGGDSQGPPPPDAQDGSLAQDASLARDASLADGAPFVPTEMIAGARLATLYCGLKAGRIKCWSDVDYFTNQVEPVAAKAPPDLVHLTMSETTESDPLFCGIDARGKGTCWGKTRTLDLGSDIKSVVVTRYGTCAAHADGRATCTDGLTQLPGGHRYVSVAGCSDFSMGLDDTGMPRHFGYQFPPAVYTRVVMKSSAPPAALRSDGVIVLPTTPPTEFRGPFVDMAFDYPGHLCAVGVTGDVSCFGVEPQAPAAVTPPPGPFVQIVGGEKTLCGLRRDGTTSCWGTVDLAVPDGW